MENSTNLRMFCDYQLKGKKDKWQAHRWDGDRYFNIYTYNSQILEWENIK